MNKKVVIIGAGQDGSYMAEYLIENTSHDIVIGVRRTSRDNLDNLSQVVGNSRVRIVTTDLTDANSITSLVKDEKPDYLLNLAGSTFVPDSFNSPAHVLQVNAISLVYILEAVRQFAPSCRVFSAGSSTEADCKSIYAVSKIAAGALCRVYRVKYGLYVVHGIMHNHCSPRQSDAFLPKKVAKGVARIAKAIKEGRPFEPLELGNLDAQIDVSWAPDLVDGIWRMMNRECYGRVKAVGCATEQARCEWLAREYLDVQYVLASGKLHTVCEMVEKAFEQVGMFQVSWEYSNLPTTLAYYGENHNGTTLVRVNPAFCRPLDRSAQPGDSSAIRRELGWQPKVTFDEIVKRMVAAEMAALGM